MAGEQMDVPEGRSPDWRRGSLASAGAIIATILLIALMLMVTSSNDARDRALASERHSYDVMLLTRTVDATLARAEVALGRYVLDEEPRTGSAFYTEWQLAGQQIASCAAGARGSGKLDRVRSCEIIGAGASLLSRHGGAARSRAPARVPTSRPEERGRISASCRSR